MSYLVFDIETIPDTSVWTPPSEMTETPPTNSTPVVPPTAGALALVSAPDIAPTPPARRRATRKPKDVFAPLYAHRVISISVVVLDDTLKLQGMSVVGTSTYGEDEKALLTAFGGYVGQMLPTLVTWNGRGFDCPVLAFRAFKHGLAWGWYDAEYRHRYRDKQIDVRDELIEHGMVDRGGLSLDVASQLIGLPGKGEFDGSKVYDAWKKKQVQKIEAYNLIDSLRQAFVFMRLMLLRGRIDVETYRAAAEGLLQKCVETAMTGITFGADPTRLLLG